MVTVINLNNASLLNISASKFRLKTNTQTDASSVTTRIARSKTQVNI